MKKNWLFASLALCAVLIGSNAWCAAWTAPTLLKIVQKDQASGTNTYTTISAALNAIPANNTNRYLIKVMPGTYTQAVPLQMKTLVDIEGSGPNTIITSAIASNTLYNQTATKATVIMAADTKISNLTVRNTAPTGGGIGILIQSSSCTVADVQVSASTASNVAGHYMGIFVDGAAATNAVVRGVTSTASMPSGIDGSVFAFVVRDNATATIRDSVGKASGGQDADCVAAREDGELTLKNSTFEASNGDYASRGITLNSGGGFLIVDGCKVTASDSPGKSLGLHHDGTIPVTVTHSEIRALNSPITYGIEAFYNTDGIILIGGTLIEGQTAPCIGVIKLASCWNEIFDPVTTCQ